MGEPQSDAALCRMSRGLSWRGPAPRDVLTPRRFLPPTPPPPHPAEGEAGWLRWLDHWSAEEVRFDGGVPVACSLAGRAFLSLGDWLFRHAPIIEVRLVAIAPFLDELAACPHVAKLRRLDLSGSGLTAEEVARLRAAFGGLPELVT